jgi:hypothetical protein
MRLPDFVQRWRTRHGIARGVAVYGPGTEDPGQLMELLATCPDLYEHAEAAGIVLDRSRRSLADLDRLVDGWRDVAQISSWLGNEAGTYLGTVLVATLPGARWQVWPNGHPVVRLASGREIDVVALGHSRVRHGHPLLAQVADDADPGG